LIFLFIGIIEATLKANKNASTIDIWIYIIKLSCLLNTYRNLLNNFL